MQDNFVLYVPLNYGSANKHTFFELRWIISSLRQIFSVEILSALAHVW